MRRKRKFYNNSIVLTTLALLTAITISAIESYNKTKKLDPVKIKIKNSTEIEEEFVETEPTASEISAQESINNEESIVIIKNIRDAQLKPPLSKNNVLEKLILDGRTKLANKKLDDAMVDFKKSISIEPTDARGHFYTGLTTSRIGNLIESLPYYQKAIELFPKYQGAHFNLAITLQKLEQYDESLNLYNRTIEFAEPSVKAKAYAAKANVHKLRKNWVAAAENYNESLLIRTDHSITWKKLASVLMKINNRSDEALQAINKAIELNNEYVSAYTLRAKINEQNRQFVNAIHDYERILKIDKDNKKALIGLVHLYRNTGRKTSALNALRKLIKENRDKAKKSFYQGYIYLIEKDYKKALPLLEEAKSNKSIKHNDKKILLAQCLASLKQHKKALKIYLDLIKDENLSEAYLSAASSAIVLKNKDLSQQLTTKLIDIAPDDPNTWINRGNYNKLIGANSNAIRNYKKAFSLGYKDKSIRLDMAKLLLKENRTKEAVETFNELTKDYPNFILAKIKFAEILLKNKKIADAEKLINEILSIKNDDLGAIELLAKIKEQQGKIDESIGLLQNAINQKPDNTAIRLELAKTYYNAKRYQNSLSEIDKIRKLNPGFLSANQLYASLLSRLNREKEAIELFKNLLKQSKSSISYAYNSALFLKNKGNTEVSEEFYKTIIAHYPNHLKSNFNLGIILKNKSQFDEAIKLLNKVKALDSNHIKTHYTLALIYAKQKFWSDSLKSIDKTLALNPKYFKAHLLKATAHERMNNFREAIISLNKAKMLKPKNNDLDERLKILTSKIKN